MAISELPILALLTSSFDRRSGRRAEAVIPTTTSRKRPIPYDIVTYASANTVERLWAASRTSAVSLPATTSSPPTTTTGYSSQPQSATGPNESRP